MSAAVVAALVLVCGGGLAALRLRAPTTVSPGGALRTRHPEFRSGTNRPHVGGTAAPSRAPGRTTAAAKPAGGGGEHAPGTPHLVTVRPSGGVTGQLVRITGTDLYSPDGLVQAWLGSADAPVRCPARTACLVTVPAGLGLPRVVPLAIETEDGTSNALSFTYEEAHALGASPPRGPRAGG